MFSLSNSRLLSRKYFDWQRPFISGNGGAIGYKVSATTKLAGRGIQRRLTGGETSVFGKQVETPASRGLGGTEGMSSKFRSSSSASASALSSCRVPLGLEIGSMSDPFRCLWMNDPGSIEF